MANSCRFALPTSTAPASARRAIAVASRSGTKSPRILDPAVVRMPFVQYRSLRLTGIPCSGPRCCPRAASRSARRACLMARSPVTVMNALIVGSRRSIRSSVALVSSTAEILRERSSRAALSIVSPVRSSARTRIRLHVVGLVALDVDRIKAVDDPAHVLEDLGQLFGCELLAKTRPVGQHLGHLRGHRPRIAQLADQHELARRLGDPLRTVLSDENRVLHLQAPETDLVVRGLHLEHHAGLERSRSGLVEDRRVVQVEADAVANVMAPVVRDAGSARRFDRRLEDPVRRHARANLLDRLLLALEDRPAEPTHLGGCLTKHL